MKDTYKKAIKNFEGPMNCCQAVICAYANDVGISEDTAYKIGSGFGGGLKSKEVCGVVSGAVMALGLAKGPKYIDDKASQEVINEKTKEFTDKFIEIHGSLTCRALRDLDICPKLVEDACKLMDEII